VLVAGASVLIARAKPSPIGRAKASQQQATVEQVAAQEKEQPAQPATPPQTPAQTPPPPVYRGPLIILDPGHGGADPGARGPNGVQEKEAVLLITRIVRIGLEREGFRVMMTRNDDSNPSYDDRAALANAHRDAVFVSIHIASTGAVATARTYFYRFASSLPEVAGTDASAAPIPAAGGPVLWEEAQESYVEASKRFADILELELAQRFPGSAATPSPAAVRELRSVALPAVAVEISNIIATDARTWTTMAPPLATAIGRTVQAFRSAGAAGGD